MLILPHLNSAFQTNDPIVKKKKKKMVGKLERPKKLFQITSTVPHVPHFILLYVIFLIMDGFSISLLLTLYHFEGMCL